MTTRHLRLNPATIHLDPTVKDADIHVFDIDAFSAEDKRCIPYLCEVKEARFSWAIRRACTLLRENELLRVELSIDEEVVAIVSRPGTHRDHNDAKQANR